MSYSSMLKTHGKQTWPELLAAYALVGLANASALPPAQAWSLAAVETMLIAGPMALMTLGIMAVWDKAAK